MALSSASLPIYGFDLPPEQSLLKAPDFSLDLKRPFKVRTQGHINLSVKTVLSVLDADFVRKGFQAVEGPTRHRHACQVSYVVLLGLALVYAEQTGVKPSLKDLSRMFYLSGELSRLPYRYNDLFNLRANHQAFDDDLSFLIIKQALQTANQFLKAGVAHLIDRHTDLLVLQQLRTFFYDCYLDTLFNVRWYLSPLYYPKDPTQVQDTFGYELAYNDKQELCLIRPNATKRKRILNIKSLPLSSRSTCIFSLTKLKGDYPCQTQML